MTQPQFNPSPQSIVPNIAPVTITDPQIVTPQQVSPTQNIPTQNNIIQNTSPEIEQANIPSSNPSPLPIVPQRTINNSNSGEKKKSFGNLFD